MDSLMDSLVDSLAVSVGVSKLACTDLFVVEPRVKLDNKVKIQ